MARIRFEEHEPGPPREPEALAARPRRHHQPAPPSHTAEAHGQRGEVVEAALRSGGGRGRKATTESR